MKAWLPLTLASLWLAWVLWLSVPGAKERINHDAKIGAIENPRYRFARSFPGLAKEMQLFDKKVQELRQSDAQRVLLLTQPGWNPMIANAIYQLYPKQVITRNVKARPVQNLDKACTATQADVALYRTAEGWQIFESTSK